MKDSSHRVDHARAAFKALFGRKPAWAASAPGRVNLIGEHTDYNGGFVLPVAIDCRAFVMAGPARGDASTIHSLNLERTTEIELTGDLSPIPRDDPAAFANYPLGVVSEFIRLGHRPPNLDLLIDSDVPIGSGLSSSAAVEVATATLLETALDVPLEPMDKALLCQRAEHAFPRTPCGIMDMYIAACAREDHALLIDCRSNESTPIPMPPADRAALIVCDTGVRHELASGEYADRRRTCEEAASRIGVEALRDATLVMLHEAGLGETAMKRATHVITENTRTLLAAEALRQGEVETLGGLMFDSHASLREMYAVSCAELDAIVDAAAGMRGDGVHGARMTGGGFGGCAIVLCESGAVERITNHIGDAFHARFERPVTQFTTAASAGARTHGVADHWGP